MGNYKITPWKVVQYLFLAHSMYMYSAQCISLLRISLSEYSLLCLENNITELRLLKP